MARFVFLSLLFLFLFLIDGSKSQLHVGFYSNTCPQVESTVHDVVREAVLFDRTKAAVLLRLHFHDCFVEGCDGSILINTTQNPEKTAFPHAGVKGFEVIERAKAQLEASCPGVVSCADIVALAARDAIVMANGPAYQVPTGRRDGFVSDKSLAGNMPDVNDSIQQLKTKFLNKGLTEKDLVLLSAAHTIGTTACFFMRKRLYEFFPFGSDPTINLNFLPELKARCPKDGDVNIRLAMDEGSDLKFDKSILKNIREGFAVLASDARLNDDFVTKSVIDSYFNPINPTFGPSFENDFVQSMVKMGQIGVKTGSVGNIRRVCSAFN
ncbi:putative peroxidase [Medicago truncatula]|uniref:Peroxidase n=1 Tax=Medicago truncatula TaxID=3880 RepID=G7IL97_MEDTR|nr:peroxidase 43 isoform X1 [Medicago truncatula]AES63385.1 class III peroxidase [Medicago truncatula]RHN71607.1 putative peroxidase [Medicago truncatula]